MQATRDKMKAEAVKIKKEKGDDNKLKKKKVTAK